MPEMLTAKEIAAALKLQPSTVTRWARDGRIPSRKLNSKVVRFSLPAVQAALGITEAITGAT